MGIPFEALMPYGIMLTVRTSTIPFKPSATGTTILSTLQMFGITGAGLSGVRALQNGGKRARHSIDAWDRTALFGIDCDTVMDRDRRLTGFLRGQTDNPSAPLGFELNNPWRLEKRFL
ncbi:hypothetical protein SBOR_4949 [Sclerotinia borealis F-4128]|uniref:NADH dehydrogenase [ubiquinone] 1 alpha subcomplex subunit 1 n=1 Tax=Sclerotinia borealis (strain F-4128) TaxID=1432307 RepID=W9CFK8_SCLBF|nr:hypothetical protein SBOR_4949 [Sclerotinia borealis F-4128]